MPAMGLEARAPAGSSCRDTFGTHCEAPRWRREIGRVTLAGFAGGVVNWWPGAHAKRGSGRSFRGYRRDPSSGTWQVLHVEISSECDDETLAVILSTRAAGEVRPLRIEVGKGHGTR